MQFTLATFQTVPDDLADSELVEIDRTTSMATYRNDDFDGLTDREKLFKKLEILQMRGTYVE